METSKRLLPASNIKPVYENSKIIIHLQLLQQHDFIDLDMTSKFQKWGLAIFFPCPVTLSTVATNRGKQPLRTQPHFYISELGFASELIPFDCSKSNLTCIPSREFQQTTEIFSSIFPFPMSKPVMSRCFNQVIRKFY